MDQDQVSSQRTEAFIRLLTEHERRLGRYAMTLVPHIQDADEILQEAKLVMWRNFDQFQLGSDFPAWGRKVIFYQVLKYRRQPVRRTQLFAEGTLELLAHEVAQTEPELERRRQLLAGCIEKLNDEYRMILKLRYNDELATEQIGERVGRTTGAVRQALSRIRRSLHDCVSLKMKTETDS